MSQNGEEKIQITPSKHLKDEDFQEEFNIRKNSLNILEVLQPQTVDDSCENSLFKCNNCDMTDTYKSFIHKYSFESLNPDFYDSFLSIKENSYKETLLNPDHIIPDESTLEICTMLFSNED